MRGAIGSGRRPPAELVIGRVGLFGARPLERRGGPRGTLIGSARRPALAGSRAVGASGALKLLELDQAAVGKQATGPNELRLLLGAQLQPLAARTVWRGRARQGELAFAWHRSPPATQSMASMASRLFDDISFLRSMKCVALERHRVASMNN